jgi:hypothetical protein
MYFVSKQQLLPIKNHEQILTVYCFEKYQSQYYDFTASWKCFEAFRKTSDDSKQPSDLDRHEVDLN